MDDFYCHIIAQGIIPLFLRLLSNNSIGNGLLALFFCVLRSVKEESSIKQGSLPIGHWYFDFSVLEPNNIWLNVAPVV